MNRFTRALNQATCPADAALLHSLGACIFTVFLAASASVLAQNKPAAASTKPAPAYELAYQEKQSVEQKKYDAAVSACASKLAPAQCKRQARLSKDQAVHAAKLERAAARTEAKKLEQSQKAAQPPKRSTEQSSLGGPSAPRKPMASKAAPPKAKHTGKALSATSSLEERRAYAAKQAKLQESVAQRKVQANKNAADREAKNQKRREAGYKVDARAAP